MKFIRNVLAAMGLLLIALTAGADGVLKKDARGCPSIQDFQKYVMEKMKGNHKYEYASYCIAVKSGDKFKGPLRTREAPWGQRMGNFSLIEIPGQGKFWIPSHWIKVEKKEKTKAP